MNEAQRNFLKGSCESFFAVYKTLAKIKVNGYDEVVPNMYIQFKSCGIKSSDK